MTPRESIVVAGDQKHLLGILTEPEYATAVGAPTVLFLTAGLLHKPGPFRMHTTLARRLAVHGIRSCRFDQSGRGDSDRPGTQESDLQLAHSDISSIMTALEGNDKKTFILCGLCSGADDILLTMSEDSRIVGAVFFDAICHPTPRFLFDRYVRRAFSLGRWIRLGKRWLSKWWGTSAEQTNSEDLYSRTFPPRSKITQCLTSFLRRRAKLLFVFTGGITEYMTYQNQFRDAYGSFDNDECLSTVYFPEADHTYSHIAARNKMMAQVEHWVLRSFVDERTNEPCP